MPDEMIVQLPLVRRLCEALRLPVLEFQGYEADAVIGPLAHQAGGKDFDVWIVSNDKDMMQLVGSNIYVLRPGTGGEKNDVFVDAAKVTELMGVPPERVTDVMALMGDSVDNIPGARDPNEQPDPVTKRRTASIGEVGAKELIQRFGSAEETLRHADEVSRATYRTALQKHGEFVRMSKELARINQDATVSLDLPSLIRREPDLAALSSLYRELGFNSLLRELGSQAVAASAVASAEPVVQTDYSQFGSILEFRDYLSGVAAGQALAVWLKLQTGEREAEGFGTPIASIEVSSKAGEGRSVWSDENGEALRELSAFLADAQRPKIVHDPKLMQILGGKAANIQHATQIYSYLLRPITANHNFADAIMRQFNPMLS